MALGVAQGQQKQPQARQRTPDELSQAVRAGDLQAIEQLRALADKGNVIAEFNLGAIYQDGDGVPKSLYVALQWYSKAAVQGYTDAQYSLGWMYEAGEGTSKDAEQAAAWYFKAAEQGNTDAQVSLAAMYENGRGVVRKKLPGSS